MAKAPRNQDADWLAERKLSEAAYRLLVQTRADAIAAIVSDWPACLRSSVNGLGGVVFFRGLPCDHEACARDAAALERLVGDVVGDVYAWIGFDVASRILRHSELEFPLRAAIEPVPATAKVIEVEQIFGEDLWAERIVIERSIGAGIETVIAALRADGRLNQSRGSGRLGELARPHRLLYLPLLRRSSASGRPLSIAGLVEAWAAMTAAWETGEDAPVSTDDAYLAWLEWGEHSRVQERLDEKDMRVAQIGRLARIQRAGPARLAS